MLDEHGEGFIDLSQTANEHCKMCMGLWRVQAWNQVVKSVLIARRAYGMDGLQW